MGKIRTVTSLLLLAALVVSFQNCGPGFTPTKLASLNSSGLQTGTVNPVSPTPSMTLPIVNEPTPTPSPYPTNPVPQNVSVVTIASGHKFTEGPVWVESLNSLVYSDISNNALYRWDGTTEKTSVLRANASVPNGNMMSDDGFLLTLEGYPERRVAKTNLATLVTTTLQGTYQGAKFNSPNDLSRFKDGSLYMTDPEYGGTPQAEKQLTYRGVFRVSSNGDVKLITKDFDQPNGIAFSPDYKSMYVADSGRDEIRKFILDEAGEVVSSSVFYKPAGSNSGNAFDGIKVDVKGNVYSSGRQGVTIINSSGVKVEFVAVNENTTNVAFGGPSKTTLFITCPTTVRKIDLLIPGF